MKESIVGALVGALISGLVTAFIFLYGLAEFKGSSASDIATIKSQISSLEADITNLRKDRMTFTEQVETTLKKAQETILNSAEDQLAKFRSIQLPETVVLTPEWYATGDTIRVLSGQVLIEITRVFVSGSSSYANFKLAIPSQPPVEYDNVKKLDRRTFELQGQKYSLDVEEFHEDSNEDSSRREQVYVSIVRIL